MQKDYKKALSTLLPSFLRDLIPIILEYRFPPRFTFSQKHNYRFNLCFQKGRHHIGKETNFVNSCGLIIKYNDSGYEVICNLNVRSLEIADNNKIWISDYNRDGISIYDFQGNLEQKMFSNYNVEMFCFSFSYLFMIITNRKWKQSLQVYTKNAFKYRYGKQLPFPVKCFAATDKRIVFCYDLKESSLCDFMATRLFDFDLEYTKAMFCDNQIIMLRSYYGIYSLDFFEAENGLLLDTWTKDKLQYEGTGLLDVAVFEENLFLIHEGGITRHSQIW